jgi:DNA-binding NtrC family response regulator
MAPTVEKSLLFVDDDPDMRDTMQGVAESLGIARCVVAGSLAEVKALGADALACRLAILDVNLGWDEPSGLDVESWLRGESFTGTIVFLTGHGNSDPRVREAAQKSHARVLLKPVSISKVAALVADSVQ